MIVYFAYGSNMLQSRLEDRVGNVRLIGRASLHDHRHSFTKHGHDGTGKGNIQPQPGAVVHGVLYELSAHQMQVLRVHEGGYFQIALPVESHSTGDRILAQTFRARHPVAPMRPSREYLDYYERGMSEHGLPEAYRALVRAQARRE